MSSEPSTEADYFQLREYDNSALKLYLVMRLNSTITSNHRRFNKWRAR